MDGPDAIILHLGPEALGGAHLPAGFPLLTVGRGPVAVVVAGARRLQKPLSAVGAPLGDKAPLQAPHQLHVDEILQPVKVQLLHQLMVLLIDLQHGVLDVHLRRVHLPRLPQAHAAHKGVHTVFIDLLCQRDFPLAFLFFKDGPIENLRQKPGVPLLDKTDRLGLLLHIGNVLFSF